MGPRFRGDDNAFFGLLVFRESPSLAPACPMTQPSCHIQPRECMSTQPVLEKIEAQSKTQSGLPIQGARKGKLLADLVRAQKPNRILEVGTLIGYSAILMAAELPSGSRITCV